MREKETWRTYWCNPVLYLKEHDDVMLCKLALSDHIIKIESKVTFDPFKEKKMSNFVIWHLLAICTVIVVSFQLDTVQQPTTKERNMEQAIRKRTCSKKDNPEDTEVSARYSVPAFGGGGTVDKTGSFTINSIEINNGKSICSKTPNVDGKMGKYYYR